MRYRYTLILLLVTVVWGMTFPVLKVATAQLSGVEVTALRFLIAAACMGPFVRGIPLQTWRDGLILGVLALTSMVAQAYGLQFISANRSAFLTSLNVLMVPLIGLALGVRPGWMVFFAAAVACAGVGLMSFDVQGDFWADLATLAAALAYALYTILMSSHAKNHRPAQLATAQIACMALLGALWMLVDSGAPRVLLLPGLVEAEVWWGLLFLGAVASAATFFLQAMAQSHVSAPQAAIIYAMEPVFAAAFGWWYISEQMTPMALLGGALVIAAVILSQRAQPPTP
jgi:drug/metabolite transporter (DMT)-like permease